MVIGFSEVGKLFNDSGTAVGKETTNFGYPPAISKPVHEGDKYASSFTCANCDFPQNDTLTTDMKYCFNCGIKLDWSDFANIK